MKKTFLSIFLALAATAFLSGCASMPRELADHKLIPGGEYTGEANNNRPDEIKYQPLPDNVQYVRASDSLVVAVYNDLQKVLASDEDSIKMAKYLFLMPGAWEYIQKGPELGGKFKRQKDKYKVHIGKKEFAFRYAIPQDTRSCRRAWTVTKRMIRYPGWSPDTTQGATPKPEPAEIKIRAISTSEMDVITKFTPFKMVEPLFVVNDRFLLGYNNKGELEVIDEIPYYNSYFERFNKIMNGED